MNISEKLIELNDIKIELRNEIENKGVTVPISTPFDQYPTYLSNILYDPYGLNVWIFSINSINETLDLPDKEVLLVLS